MIRKLDLYVVRAFVPPLLMCTAAVVGLYIVADAFQRLNDFLEIQVHLLVPLIIKYYGMLAPLKAIQLLPSTIVIGAGLALADMAKRNEITAMKACGISLYRITMPIFVLSIVLGMLVFIAQETIIPKLALNVLHLSRSLGEQTRLENYSGNDPKTKIRFWIHSLDLTNNAMRGIAAVQQREDGTRAMMLRAEKGIWVGKDWLLEDVTVSKYEASGACIGKPQQIKEYAVSTDLTIDDLNIAQLDPSMLTVDQLRVLHRRYPRDRRYVVMLHSRMVEPLTGVVLLLIGIPFLLGNSGLSRSRMLGVLACILICVAFWATKFVCTSLGNEAHLPALLAAWLPIALFGSVGVLLFDSTRT